MAVSAEDEWRSFRSLAGRPAWTANREFDRPEIATRHASRLPFVLSKSPCELKMSDDEIAKLVTEGVLQ